MQTADDDRTIETRFQELAALAASEMARFKIPGAAIGIIAGEEEFTAGLGVTSIENPLDVTPETLFQIGSTGKTFTTSTILRLVEQGKLSLDDPVRKHIPEFSVQDEEASAKATVRHLLNHTGGWIGDHFEMTGFGEDALARYIATLADLPQVSPLGMFFAYNNTSFCVAGRVIEAVTGKRYEDAVHELLFEPLGMNSSFFFPQETMEILLHSFAAGHVEREGEVILARPWGFDRNVTPAGGVCCDVHDQLRFARFHMGDGKTANGELLLSPEALKLMQTPVNPAGGEGWMGMNWFIEDIEGIRFVAHGGSTNGQKAEFWMAPGEQFAFISVTNQTRGSALNSELTRWVREHFLGVVKRKPTPEKLPEEMLPEYAASFVMGGIEDLYTFIPQEGGLLMSQEIGDHSAITEIPPEPEPPARCLSIGPDRFLFIDEPMKDEQIEFLRDPDGKIAWIRLGGRVLARKR